MKPPRLTNVETAKAVRETGSPLYLNDFVMIAVPRSRNAKLLQRQLVDLPDLASGWLGIRAFLRTEEEK